MSDFNVNTNIANNGDTADKTDLSEKTVSPVALATLFAVPIEADAPELSDIAFDARIHFQAYAGEPEESPALTVEQLRANVATLAPAARHFLPQTYTIDAEYYPIGSKKSVRGQQVQCSPVLVQFALNALALYEAEQGSGLDAQPEADAEPVEESDVPEATWDDVAHALQGAADMASGADEGTFLDYVCNLKDAQHNHEILLKADRGLGWLLHLFREQTQGILKDREEDVAGFCAILAEMNSEGAQHGQGTS